MPATTTPARPADRRAALGGVLATPFGRVAVPTPIPVSFAALPCAAGLTGGRQQLCTPWQGATIAVRPVPPVSFSALAAPVVPAVPVPRLGRE
jgi:hypothetical protein